MCNARFSSNSRAQMQSPFLKVGNCWYLRTWCRLLFACFHPYDLVHLLPFSLPTLPMPTRWATMTKDHARYKLHAIPNAFLSQSSPGICSLWVYLAFRSHASWTDSRLLWWRFVATQGCGLVYRRRNMQCWEYVFTLTLTYFTKMQ